jgi:hypothetical protein
MNHLDNYKLLQQCQSIVIVTMKTISHHEDVASSHNHINWNCIKHFIRPTCQVPFIIISLSLTIWAMLWTCFEVATQQCSIDPQFECNSIDIQYWTTMVCFIIKNTNWPQKNDTPLICLRIFKTKMQNCAFCKFL